MIVKRSALALGLLVWACSGDVQSDGQNTSGGDNGNTQNNGVVIVDDTGDFIAHESVARRLSRAELNNTLSELLGDESQAASDFLPEDAFAPYDNDYTSQTASAALIDSLEQFALAVGIATSERERSQGTFVSCTPGSAGDTECFRTVVTSLLRRAFRRPVSSEEVERYLRLLEFATEDNPEVSNDFYTAVDLLVRSVLQDPEFLYRIEVGAATQLPSVFALDSHEIATRMSYLLWGSMPDAELFAAADANSLVDAGQRREMALRMLNQPQARTQLERFHSMWLGYRALPHAPELNAAFERETSALLDRVIFDEHSSYLDLFSFGETFVDSTLAEHYGLSAPPGGEGWVSYGDSGRAGLLSHGSVLSAFAKFSDTSPTQRGIFVRTRLLCDVVLPPPPNVNADEPPGEADAACKYDRYAQHRSGGSCKACHDQLDPIGFGLENYDREGRYREHDDGHPECLIAGEGELKPYGTFNGPAQLGQILVDQGEIEDCLVRQYLTFAVGRTLASSEEPEALRLVGEFQNLGYSLQELLLQFIERDAFALRREPEAN